LLLLVLVGLLFYPEDGGDVFFITTQMTVLLIVTAVRTSYPAQIFPVQSAYHSVGPRLLANKAKKGGPHCYI
jgi:hypothetical protein